MNDEIREQLSAYLDGALPEAVRRTLEARLSASPDLRRELEEMRSVSKAVKSLPREPLPAGFLSRFQARRARGESPRPDWIFLPPSARPFALALSCGIVALVLWDKVVTPPLLVNPSGTGAKVSDADHEPDSQFDLSGAISGAASASSPAAALASSPMTAPASAPAAAQQAVARGAAAGGPVENAPQRPAMSEEERSARNEQMFRVLEQEKKKMGIARIPLRKEAALAAAAAATRPETTIHGATPGLLQSSGGSRPAGAPAASAGGASSAPDRTGAVASGRPSPDAGLVLTDTQGLRSAWTLLGLPGDPPSVDFAANRIILIKPSATRILSVVARPDAVAVAYRSLTPGEPSDPARDRVAAIPLQPRNVLILDATPR